MTAAAQTQSVLELTSFVTLGSRVIMAAPDPGRYYTKQERHRISGLNKRLEQLDEAAQPGPPGKCPVCQVASPALHTVLLMEMKIC